MEKLELLYEGKAKRLFKTKDPNLLISEFKDDLTSGNATKKGSQEGKGALNCKISTQLFALLEKAGIKTHLVKTLDDNNKAKMIINWNFALNILGNIVLLFRCK